MIVVIGDACTSLFAGCVIFCILGFMAKTRDISVAEVAGSGTGLAFVAYPEVVTKLPISPLWAIVFFFMLVTLGLDSQFAMMETIATGLMDTFPNLRSRKTWLMLSLCCCGFLIGICMTTKGGVYIQYLMDSYAAGWSLIVIAGLEVIIVTYIYGLENFSSDLYLMLGFRPGKFWVWCWRVVTPALLFIILIYSLYTHAPLVYGDTYTYPEWANGLGWCMALAAIFMVPGWALAEMVRLRRAHHDWGVKQIFLHLLRPAAEWGPALDRHRTGSRYKPLNSDLGMTETSATPGGNSQHLDVPYTNMAFARNQSDNSLKTDTAQRLATVESGVCLMNDGGDNQESKQTLNQL